MNTHVGRLAPMVLVPAMALALVGCSDDKKDGDAGAEPSATPSSTATPSATTTSPVDLPVPPKVAQAKGGVADIKWDPTTCKTEAGKQTVSGTVTNPGRRATDYLITISWTNATSDTLGLGFATVEGAKSRTSTDWKLSATVPDGAVQCVINVLRGDVRA